MHLQSSAASNQYEKTAAEIRASSMPDRIMRAYRQLGSVPQSWGKKLIKGRLN